MDNSKILIIKKLQYFKFKSINSTLALSIFSNSVAYYL